MTDISVGTKLWFVPGRRNGAPCEITVKAVGRKWLATDWRGMRLDKTTLRADGGQYASPGTAYRSREEYEVRQQLQTAWNSLKTKVCETWCVPAGLTLAAVAEAHALIFGGHRSGNSTGDAPEKPAE